MKFRFFINGIFLLGVYFLLFHNTKNWRQPTSDRSFDHLFDESVGPDSLIGLIREDSLLVTEIDRILLRVEREQLTDQIRGKAIIYATAKQAQARVDEGHESDIMDGIITFLEGNTIFLELPKSDWQKFQDYFKDCLFKQLRCDHLLNRTISHEYFPLALIGGVAFILFTLFLLIRPRVVRYLSGIKIRQNETIDHTIPYNPGNR